MQQRTDLALEAHALAGGNIDGARLEKEQKDGVKISRLEIKTQSAAEKIGKPAGKYITLEIGNIADGITETEGAEDLISGEISALLGEFSRALVIGVGNSDITPDALGPRAAAGVLATRHIVGEFAEKIGLRGLRSVSVLSPGVLGQTGLEPAEIIKSIVNEIDPDAIIAIDALAAGSAERLGTTVQINDSGVFPGSGVGNRRRELSQKTLGRRVIAVGLPTVADSSCFGTGGYIVTPRDIDLLISRASELISHALNFALQPETDREILLSLV